MQEKNIQHEQDDVTAKVENSRDWGWDNVSLLAAFCLGFAVAWVLALALNTPNCQPMDVISYNKGQSYPVDIVCPPECPDPPSTPLAWEDVPASGDPSKKRLRPPDQADQIKPEGNTKDIMHYCCVPELCRSLGRVLNVKEAPDGRRQMVEKRSPTRRKGVMSHLLANLYGDAKDP